MAPTEPIDRESISEEESSLAARPIKEPNFVVESDKNDENSEEEDGNLEVSAPLSYNDSKSEEEEVSRNYSSF